ncbi:hypothetical protein FM115_07690 [Marinilactibacillus psychrotolerans 42ea]|uniref:Uncharacterized protein n=1 Tax=Marinilactibacillus psychrotolerans 42ea TaxID=1255609 RepID=A0A1R4K112_9LACT|nr:hypothetical protein [Marinilactibacillus psychrotolerans]SJN37939.1 hypothetical protein FM115_07690 [Marinilactibacillus psychrotolerans 42ea]
MEESCHSNQQLIEDGYKRLMLYENSDMTITVYMDSNQLEQCPGHGIYTYVDD